MYVYMIILLKKGKKRYKGAFLDIHTQLRRISKILVYMAFASSNYDAYKMSVV
jgi:hypothetical protein